MADYDALVLLYAASPTNKSGGVVRSNDNCLHFGGSLERGAHVSVPERTFGRLFGKGWIDDLGKVTAAGKRHLENSRA